MSQSYNINLGVSANQWKNLWIHSGTYLTGWEYPLYVCDACGNEIKDGDHVSIQIGKDDIIFYHKSCFLNPEVQQEVKGLVIFEDLT